MNDPLAQLLRDADAATTVPAPSPGLTNRVQHRRNRQRLRHQFATGAMSLLIVFAACAWGLIRTRNVTAPPLAVSPAPIVKPEPSSVAAPTLADLQFEAELHARTAEILMASRGSSRRASAAPPANVANDPQTQRDRAALILVYDAERSAKENRPADAIAAYRRAVELFPRSHWAEVARQRLKQMRQSSAEPIEEFS